MSTILYKSVLKLFDEPMTKSLVKYIYHRKKSFRSLT